MTRCVTAALILVVLMLSAAPISAHEEFRLVGTITKLQSNKIDMKTTEGEKVSVALDKQTSVTRDKKKVAPTELKAGRSVVIIAFGDSFDDLLALEVRIVPTIAAAPAKPKK